jgi:hypothetical protein
MRRVPEERPGAAPAVRVAGVATRRQRGAGVGAKDGGNGELPQVLHYSGERRAGGGLPGAATARGDEFRRIERAASGGIPDTGAGVGGGIEGRRGRGFSAETLARTACGLGLDAETRRRGGRGGEDGCENQNLRARRQRRLRGFAARHRSRSKAEPGRSSCSDAETTSCEWLPERKEVRAALGLTG